MTTRVGVWNELTAGLERSSADAAIAATDAPLVSVLVPTYNRPEFLGESLDSAVRQTYRRIEILVGDNGGSRENEAIVRSFADARIIYHRRPRNLGLVLNHLSLIREARGKYFAILHDDNFWRPDFLERLVTPLEEHPDVAVAFSDQFLVDRRGQIDLEKTEYMTCRHNRVRLPAGRHKPAQELGLVRRSISVATAAVVRTSAMKLDVVPSQVGTSLDLWLTYLALASGAAAYYHPERLAHCRVHEGATSEADLLALGESAIFCYRQMMEDSRLAPYWKAFGAAIESRHQRLGLMLLQEGETRQARSYLSAACREKPRLRSLVGLGISLLPGRLGPRIAQAVRALVGAWRYISEKV